MNLRRTVALVFSVLLAFRSLERPVDADPCILVTNNLADTIAIIDGRTNTVSRTIFLPPPLNYCLVEPDVRRILPSGIALSADGSRAFLVTGSCISLRVVFPEGSSEITVGMGSRLNRGGIVLSLDDARAYSTDSSTNTVITLNTEQNMFLPPIAVGLHPVSLARSTDGELLFVANRGDTLNPDPDTLSIVSTASGEEISTIEVGDQPVAVVADQNRIFVANAASDSISVIDPTALMLVDTIPLTLPGSLSLSPDGKTLYVTTATGLAFIDSSTYATEILPGMPAGNLAVTPDGQTLYVVNAPDNSVIALDTATRLPIATIVLPHRTCPQICESLGIAIGTIDGGCATCIGDCEGDEQVRVDELRNGIEIMLGDRLLDMCRSFDSDLSGGVTVDEVVSAVVNSIDGCGR